MKNGRILLLIVGFSFCAFGFLQAQQKIDSLKCQKFWNLNKQQEIDISKGYDVGVKMLLLAQNDYEKSIANSVVAENRYVVGDYVKAVNYLEKARIHAWKTDSISQKIRVLNYLIFSYRRAGLPNKSDAYFEQLKKVVKNYPAEDRDASISYVQCKIYDIDEEFCKSAIIRRKYLSYDLQDDHRSDFDKRYQYSMLCQSAYVQLKCGDLAETYKIFKQLDNLYTKIEDKNTIMLMEFYLMAQGMVAARSNDKELSRKLFDSAVVIADAAGGKVVQKVILTERLETNVDSPSEQFKYAKIIRNITNSETRITQDLTQVESQKVQEILDENKHRQQLFVALGIGIFVLFSSFIYLYFRRNKKLKQKYLEIIQEIERDKSQTQSLDQLPEVGQAKNEASSPIVEPEPKKESLISEARELEILTNLEIFERKKLFTTNGISTAQMAVMVKTNTKYLSHILKKYRNSDFNQYINQKRIDYIVEELHANPQARNYKIAILAEMCGYNSHPQFANIFKTLKGISPSQFVKFLEK